MPGLDLSQLSGNWKKLQENLQAGKKDERQNLRVKRKRQDEKIVNGYKKTKLSDSRLIRPARKMGTSWSRFEEPQPKAQNRSTLVNQHGIAQEDISAAYGTANSLPRSYTDTPNSSLHPTHKAGKYLSLDCEMVGTGPPPHTDNVLARVSVVNFHGEQIYDSYVLPPPGVKVEDYRTFVSGVKREHLVEGYARPFGEVQKDIADLLEGRILVGHALRNDLQALLLSHPKRDMRDTSRYPKFREMSGGKPPALRNLARSELGVEIQEGEHSSIEDARVAMELFRKEKVGFEEENRKAFGRRTKFDAKGAREANGVTNGDIVEDEEDADDPEPLDGEEEEDEDGSEKEAAPKRIPQPSAKKKRKKKKRTKRK